MADLLLLLLLLLPNSDRFGNPLCPLFQFSAHLLIRSPHPRPISRFQTRQKQLISQVGTTTPTEPPGGGETELKTLDCPADGVLY